MSSFNEHSASSHKRRKPSTTNNTSAGAGAVNNGLGSSSIASNECFAFAKGECARGDSCRFSHASASLTSIPSASDPAQVPREKSRKTKLNIDASVAAGTGDVPLVEICRKFQMGKCARGDGCKFKHEAGAQAEVAIQSTSHAPKMSKASASNVSSGSATPASSATQTGIKSASHVTGDRFGDLRISAESRRALAEVFKYEFMTAVQSSTLPSILRGLDCLAKAKTGTGKTLGFLIPTVENIIKTRASSGTGISNTHILTLVLSPTRELAAQIASEANQLLTFHTGCRVVVVFGGTNIKKDNTALQGRVDILVATPGRLLDHLQQGLNSRFAKLQVLIMDEADQLLDMGFRPDIDRILALLPSKENRQTLLFSATVPRAVQEVAAVSLKKGYAFVDTVGEEEEQTHLHVKQELVIASNEEQIRVLAAILDQEIAKKPIYKIIVFFTTARVTQYMAQLFNTMGMKVMEIHSRKSQAQRTAISNQFRDARTAILFSSDVSARGMDYPDVTFVLQVGLTEREQYIHRLGRTARAGKEGKGMLFLAPYEERSMVQTLKDMPLQKVAIIPTNDIVQKCLRAIQGVPRNIELKKTAEQAYCAWLGYYNTNCKKCGWDKAELVRQANILAGYFGLIEQPKLQKKTIGMMGLKGVPGLLVDTESRFAGRD